MSERRRRPAHFVQSLERGLAVIRALSEPAPLSVADVARATKLSRATARRSLLTLSALGYVREIDGRFTLTPRMLELGFAYLSSLSLPQIAQPHLEALVEHVRESSSVSILDGNEVVYVARVPTRRIMTVAISVGTRFPAYATSMGRVLLAALEPAESAARIAASDLRPLTRATLHAPRSLDAELARVRRQGWALVDGELEVGLRSIAVPIRDRAGAVLAAVNLSVQAGSEPPTRTRERLLAPLRDTAATIERDLVSA